MQTTSGREMLRPKAIIGMIHVGALPGTPYATADLQAVVDQVAKEAEILQTSGFDAIMIENMHDRPYLMREVGPEIVAGMTAAGLAVKQASSLPLGVQILAGANRHALAVAQACGASFVRVEGFVFSHIADEGLMVSADAGELLRYRQTIGAESIAVWADVKKKHSSHAITADVDLAETSKAAEFFGADALIVTGTATGQPAKPDDVKTAASAANVPIMIGSGITPHNLEDYWASTDGFIVGSYFKKDGLWSNPPDQSRIEKLMAAVSKLRG